MALKHSKLTALVAGSVVGLGLASTAFGGDEGREAADRRDAELRCEIAVDERRSSIALEALVMSEVPVEGEYRFRVSKRGGGSARIDQSGLFFADRGKPHRVGVVTLGADGGSYTATLELDADGEEVSCSERIGGRL